MSTKRKPMPAGGQPTPATIEAADATPPANTTPAADSQSDAATSQAGDDQGQSNPPGDPAAPAADVASEQPAPAPPAEDAPRQDDVSEVDQDEIVDARVLIAFDEYAVDDIFSAPARAIEQLKLAGRVDPHPDAVAFARELLA